MGWLGAPGCCGIPAAGCGGNDGPILAIISQVVDSPPAWISTRDEPRYRMRFLTGREIARLRSEVAGGATLPIALGNVLLRISRL